MELQYDLTNFVFDLRLRPRTPGPQGTSVVCEGCVLLLDSEGRWIGIELRPTAAEVEECSELWWTPELTRGLQQRQQFLWAPKAPISGTRSQEMILEVDAHGLYSVEILLFLENRSVAFSLVQQFGRSY